MALTNDEQAFITQLRNRSIPNHPEPPTLDEMKRAILLLRGSRKLASEAAAASATKSRAKKAPSTAEVSNALADLDSM